MKPSSRHCVTRIGNTEVIINQPVTSRQYQYKTKVCPTMARIYFIFIHLFCYDFFRLRRLRLQHHRLGETTFITRMKHLVKLVSHQSQTLQMTAFRTTEKEHAETGRSICMNSTITYVYGHGSIVDHHFKYND